MVDEVAPVLLAVDDGLAIITLNRPEKYNAMSMEFAVAFHQSVAAIASRSDVRAVLIDANGPAFCAGGDLAAMAAAPDRPAFLTELAIQLHGALALLGSLPLVVVVAAHGVVAGGGVGLVLAGDIVIAGDDVSFLAAYSGLGFTPDCGVTANLPAAVGVRRALQFSVGGTKLMATDALEWGLVNEVVPVDKVGSTARERARTVIATAPRALGETRLMMRSSVRRDLEQNLDLEAATIVARSSSDEAVRLFDEFLATRASKK